jgi:lipopolysaccharide transport system ATP-binding protein
MSNTAIKVDNLSKIYRLGEIGTGTISRDMERWFKTKVLNQEDPFLKIGERNDRSRKGASDIVYSLQDINFEIQQGDAVGIIGRNGAGKSTLLKILSRVTTPSTGKINIKGRVASLLEVGTGFHPELTGRENIYLNGAILGMRKREIDRKLDEIIDFSGVERYIDTPVKRYSSGMYVRLAFAVAAHLESEIMIVDEVLAVGDAEFQKKCLGKMGEVSKNQGRTVLFVSHNMSAVSNLCNNALLLQNGQLTLHGDVASVTEAYFRIGLESIISPNLNLENLKLSNFEISTNFQVRLGGELRFKFRIDNLFDKIRKPEFNFEIRNILGQNVSCIGNEFVNCKLILTGHSENEVIIGVDNCFFQPGHYIVDFYYLDNWLDKPIYIRDFLDFQIIEEDIFNTGKLPTQQVHGVVLSLPKVFLNNENCNIV